MTTPSTELTPGTAADPLSRPVWRRRAGAAAVGTYVVVALWIWRRDGIPLEREQVLAWLLGFVLIVSVARGARFPTLARAVRDWSLLAGLFIAYDYTRGAADALGMPLQIQTPINIDKALFFGHVPTVWLQERLGPFHGTRWWEAAVSVTYLSFFVVPHTITAVLWLRDRVRWRAWITMWSTTTVLGLTGYILVPTMPPWMASGQGFIGPVERVTNRGWRLVNLHIAEQMFDKGRATFNLVAAFPSLHAAYPALVTAYFWNRARPAWRPLLAAYPLMMGFSIVIGGEHYVTDVLAGWAAVAAAVGLWRLANRNERVHRWAVSDPPSPAAERLSG